MATQDISRYLLQPKKHYSSLHLQQGRVIVDSDWNERAGIEAEELRQTVLDVVCARGTPNDGFAVSLAEAQVDWEQTVVIPGEADHPTYDFTIGGGSYYLGGMRLAIDNGAGSESFLSQSDWLQVTSNSANMPAQFSAGTRTDLVYVYVWEQPVTAVEDSELREVALGGRDTSVRIKRMRRFMVETGVDNNCVTAFSTVIANLEEVDKASYNAVTGELESLGRLRVSSATVPVSEDPCAPPTTGGYVGADNQAIRVELRAGGKLTWGFDNASRLYRVQISGTTASLLTVPEDVASMPRAGQVVEVLQWGAVLPNLEKVAELEGLVTVATTSYNPQSRQLELDLDAAAQTQIANWNTWLASNTDYHNPRDDENLEQYLYLRVWDRGSDLASTAAEALLSYTAGGAAVPLGNTGLEVVVQEDGKAGDYWIIAARPSTPGAVTPWDLGAVDGVAPHGPRRFYAPLALVDWTDNPSVGHTVGDCRTTLRQLCEGGTCTITVGDGKNSFGDVSSLQEAIELASDGSKICLLPGEHEGHAEIFERSGLIIEGCGVRSILRNAQPTTPNTDFTAFDLPIIRIEDSTDIVIRDVGIFAYSAVGVEIVDGGGALACKNITLDRVQIGCFGGYTLGADEAANSWWLPASGVTVAGASEVELRGCHVHMTAVLSFAFAVVLGGDALRMRGCTIRADRGNQEVSPALGGVNVRSGSRNVEIIDCEIRGGWGHGIALGHGRDYEVEATPSIDYVVGESVTLGAAGTAGEDPCACEPGSDGGVIWGSVVLEQKPKFLPAGPVEDVRLWDNRISEMGLSGISTTLFWPADHDYGTDAGAPRFIVVTDVDIARNVIEDNVKLALPPAMFLDFDIAVGGVCLAASTNAWVHENTIRNNGTQYTLTPICGVGLVAAMNAVIEDNQIVDNGVRLPAGSKLTLQRGLRGGIVVWEASGVRTKAKPSSVEHMPTFPTGTGTEVPPAPVKDWLGVSSQSAVTVRGNEVSHPLGRALWVRRGFGPIVVTGNSLESYGSPVLTDAIPGATLSWLYKDLDAGTEGALAYAAAGACVEISNLALSEDTGWDPADPNPPAYPTMQYVDPSEDEMSGGAVLLSGNRIRLEWEREGGWATSVLAQSLGSIMFHDNSSEAVTGSSFSTSAPEGQKDWDFITRICDEAIRNSVLLTHVFVGARASVSVVGNRMTEGRWDAVFSAIVRTPALAADGELVGSVDASLAAGNVGTHCIIATDAGEGSAARRVDNVEIHGFEYTPLAGPTYNCGNAAVYAVGDFGQSTTVGVLLQIDPVPG